ncbi:MAG: HutP family protein [Bacillota bacterium]
MGEEKVNTIGKLAIKIVVAEEEERLHLIEQGIKEGYKICVGKVGTMNAEKVISAVITATKRDNLWDARSFREEHALYDAAVEALNGICRGQLVVSDVLRTVGLTFSVLRGRMNRVDGEWIAVCLYGTIGAPIKGFEHETIGLGINHI